MLLSKEKLLDEIQSEIEILQHAITDTKKDISNFRFDIQRLISFEIWIGKLETLQKYEKEIIDGKYDEK